jgi:hypothetical protein
MTDDEIGTLVLAGLADGMLPRQSLGIAQPQNPGQPIQNLMDLGSFPDPCAVCGGRPTQARYGSPGGSGGSIAFHDRCHGIWMGEIGKRR